MTEWMAFYKLHPWGDDRADLRMGILASVQANVHRGKGKKAFEPEDFIPKFDIPEEKQRPTPEMMLQKVELMNRLLGGKDLRNQNG